MDDKIPTTTTLPVGPPPALPPEVDALRKASAVKREEVTRRLGEPVSRPATGPRRDRQMPATVQRERSGLFDAPDDKTRKVKEAVVAVRGRLSEIARAITSAESTCPRWMTLLGDPEAAEIAARLEDFDAAAAQKFLTAAGELLDAFKPKAGQS